LSLCFIPILLQQKGLEFCRGWEVSKNKEFKETYEALLGIPKGGEGILDKISSVGRYGYCPGTHMKLTTKMILKLLFWCCFVQRHFMMYQS